MTKKTITKAIIDIIDSRVQIYLEDLKFNKTLYGKVISYSNNIAVVEIDEIQYKCDCKISVTIGKVVRVIAPNNNYKKLYVDGIE